MTQSLQVVAVLFLGFVCNFGCIGLHELGHLIAAWCSGWTPLVFKMGSGPGWTIGRIGDLDFKIGPKPFTGLVRAAARSPACFRIKLFVFAVSGPVMSALAIWLLWTLLHRVQDDPTWPQWIPWGLLVAIVLHMVILVGSVWPGMVLIDGTRFSSDGKLVWLSLTMSEPTAREQFLEHTCGMTQLLIDRGEIVRAKLVISTVKNDLRTTSTNLSILWIHLLLQGGKTEEARGEIASLEEAASVPGASGWAILDSLACLPLYYGHSALNQEALAWIEEAIDQAPDEITLKGTKGSLLVVSGQPEEGLRLLSEVVAQTKCANDAAIGSYYIALAHNLTGNWKLGRELLEAAERRYPECVVRIRVHDLFWNGATSSTQSPTPP